MRTIVSLINVPVMVDGKTWGVLEVDHDEPHRFEDIDTGFLTSFANVLGLALRCHESNQLALTAAARHARELAQAEILLRELQHRVKNNFQTIIAFMGLQRRHISSDAQDRFRSVMDRVQAIAFAYDQLSLTEGGSEVEFGDYLRALCANIAPHGEGVLIEVDASTTTLPLDRAVPAGLIVNELVTNCLKYAFDSSGGTIQVTFSVEPEIG